MKCPKCGKELNQPGLKFCTYCGAKIDSSEIGSTKQPEIKKQSEIRRKPETLPMGEVKVPLSKKLSPLTIGILILIFAVALLAKSCGGKKETKEPDVKVSDQTTGVTENGQKQSAEEQITEEQDTDKQTEETKSDTENQSVSDTEAVEDGKGNSEEYKTKYEQQMGSLNTIRDLPLPDGLNSDQQKELEDIYEASYNDEKEFLPAAVEEAIQNYDEYGDLKQTFRDMMGTMEEAYQVINDWDPNLKDVVAEDAAFRYGNSPLEYYLIDKGVGTVLADNELGKEIRSGVEAVGMDLLASFLIWSDQQDRTTRKDAVEPVAVGENYALVRSLGCINELLDEVEKLGSYEIKNQVYELRQGNLNSELNYSFADCVYSKGDALYDAWVLAEKNAGRQQALNEAVEDAENEKNQYKTIVLEKFGITDEETVKALLGLEDEDTTYQDDEEYDEEYEEKKEEEIYRIGHEYLFSIIDKEGNTYGSFLCSYDTDDNTISASITKDGMCSIAYGDLNSDDCINHVIVSREGKELFRNEEKDKDGNKSMYYDVTPSGNVLHKIFDSDFDHGDYQILEWVKPDGTTKKLMESGTINLSPIGNENPDAGWLEVGFTGETKARYYRYDCSYEDDADSYEEGYIDMETGEILTNEEYQKANPEDVTEENDNYEETDDPKAEILREGSRLNDDYILYDDIVYDNSAEKVTSLEAGRGVADIFYANNYYWIVTRSGWYYVLDDNFKQILEPVEFGEDQTYKLTGYGLMIQTTPDSDSDEEQKFELYNEKGEVVLYLPGDLDLDQDAHGFIFGNKKVGWANLNTKESMLLSMPDGDIDTIEF